jgi:hypothetical protein
MKSLGGNGIFLFANCFFENEAVRVSGSNLKQSAVVKKKNRAA